MYFRFDYASPSVFESDRDRALLGLSTAASRPVRFHGQVVRHGFILRIALRALGEAIWSEDSWASEVGFGSWGILDPVITVHPDRLFFEAFSQDQSVYAALIVDPEIFRTEGKVITGTTNVDFTAWLWGAVGEMRTSRDTWLRIGPEGFEVTTAGAGGRFERKVDVPEPWLRGFLQLQGAMAMPGTRLTVRPIDLLAALRFLRYTKAKMSPRALRYEFEPGAEARLVLEPWEHAVTLRGTSHEYEKPRVIRTWGRRRLRLIEGLLPFAESVDVYLKGRALPSFYAVKLPGMTFLLGLSGWSAQGWSESGSFDLLADAAATDDERLEAARETLRERVHMGIGRLAEAIGVERPVASRLLVRLCRRGEAVYDVERREYRHRLLFAAPPDEARLFPPERRLEEAAELLARGAVRVETCHAEETRRIRKLPGPEGPRRREVVYRDWRVRGAAGGHEPVEIVVNDAGRIIFGRCRCDFFDEHLLNRGPCAHMLALFRHSEPERRDGPVSREAGADEADRPTRPSRSEIESGEVEGLDSDDDEDDDA